MTEFAPFISSLWNSIEKYPQAQWKTALSYGQLRSKEWLIEKANTTYQDKSFSTAFLIGGWYGLLPALWKQQSFCPIKKFRNIDSDESCLEISESVNKRWVIDDWQFKATTADALHIDYTSTQLSVLKHNGERITLYETPDLIINTCCEHFSDLNAWLDRIPEGTNIILQSNNFSSEPQHVSCSTSLENFLSKTKLSTVYYSGELPLNEYNRYLIIGIK
ncbi:MAG: hypothetical protein IT287_07885 [Bdellovibrionaceae bacterium]|nr:hypothetical protein [Pseudobdellovibrionaceae bacterium]